MTGSTWSRLAYGCATIIALAIFMALALIVAGWLLGLGWRLAG